jgi:hypothetical protein
MAAALASRTIFLAALRRFALIYVASLIAVGTLYYHTNITFLRADSGYYQLLAHLRGAQQKAALRQFWLTSVSGHYTPLAFSAEFFFTKFAGTREAIWLPTDQRSSTDRRSPLLPACFRNAQPRFFIARIGYDLGRHHPRFPF